MGKNKDIEEHEPEDDNTNNTDGKYGEPTKYDPSFNGPIKNRSCTDVICCILFIVCFVGMIFVAGWAFLHGDPTILIYPTDSEGNVCGIGDYADKPYVFFFDFTDCATLGLAVITSGCPTPQVCVSECPNATYTWHQVQISGDKSELVCKPGSDVTSKSVQELVEDEDCAAYYLESEPLVGRCVPTVVTDLIESASNLNGTEIVDKVGNLVNGTVLEEGLDAIKYLLNAQAYGEKIFSDVRASWWMCLIGLCVGMLISFIWIILMRWIAGPIIWLTLLLFLVLFTFTTYYTFDKYVDLKDNPTSQINGLEDIEFTTDLDYYLNLAYTWLVLGILSAICLAVVLIILIFLRNRIRIAIALIGESSRAVGAMIFTLFWPLIPFVLELILFAFWGASALYLASSGNSNFGVANKTVVNETETLSNGSTVTTIKVYISEITSNIPCDETDNSTAGSFCSFIKYGGDEYTIYLQFYQLFMLFWCMNFIIALGQMTLAGAFASYYWAFNKPKDIPTFPLAGSFYRCFRYHLGSLAFGSLIIAIIQMIRVFLEYLDHKLKGSENAVAKFFLKCLKCCFWCLEKFMKFINKNAYILIAVYGKNFCTSAKNAFMLIMRNIIRVVVVDKVTDFILIVGKLMVVAAVGGLAFAFFSGELSNAIPIQSISDYIADYTPTLNYYLTPVIIITIGTYIIAAAFFSVYNMAVDTLFLCFLEDLERHDGSAEKPYYMSKELMKILGKKNKKPEDEEKKKKKKGCCGCC